MDRVTAAEVFISIVDSGSMAAAAERLGMSRSMVTRYLAQMEDWAGARLLHRSTRRLSLTAAGEQALERCRALRDIARDLSTSIAPSDEAPQGHLRLSCSQFLSDLIMPVLDAYLTQYPAVSIDLQIRNEKVNLVDERIDLALRVTNDLDPNIIARPLGQCESVLCASPRYLQQRGTPQRPEQLSDHNCLLYANFGRALWTLQRHDQESERIAVSGNLCSNDTRSLLDAALRAMGICMLPEPQARAALASDDLVQILPDYQPEAMGIYGIYRSRTHMPRALRLLIDALAEAMT